MSLKKRYLIFIIGVIIQSSGIALITRSTLGSPPISSAPYVGTQLSNFTLGELTFWFNVALVIGQIVLLKRRFRHIQLLQLPVTFVFAAGLDIFMQLFAWTLSQNYFVNVVVLAIGEILLAMGVALQVIANVLMLPGEGIVFAISRVFKWDFGRVKTCFDCSVVATAVVMSLCFLHSLAGVREGTLAVALLTGIIARFLIKHLSYFDEDGGLIFRFPWTKIHKRKLHTAEKAEKAD